MTLLQLLEGWLTAKWAGGQADSWADWLTGWRAGGWRLGSQLGRLADGLAGGRLAVRQPVGQIG